MSKIVNESIQKVANGTAIIFIGTIIGMLLAFVGKTIVIRYTTQTEYGIFSLAMAVLNIFVIIASLGLQQGVVRQIAYYKGKNDCQKVIGVIKSSIQIGLVSGISFAILLFFDI